MTRIGVLVPRPPGADRWSDAAHEVAELLTGQGHEVDVIVGMPDALAAEWEIVLAHGGQYEQVLGRDTVSRPKIMSDLPAYPYAPDTTYVDWNWREGIRRAAAIAAALAPSGGRVGLVAGPHVPTQSLISTEFVNAVRIARSDVTADVVHLPAFDDAEAAITAARTMARHGCHTIVHSVDEAGAIALADVRDSVAHTIGFLHLDEGDLAGVESDVAGILTRVVAATLAHEDVPRIVTASGENDEISVRFSPTAARSIVETAVAVERLTFPKTPSHLRWIPESRRVTTTANRTE